MRVSTQAVHFTADQTLIQFIEEKLQKLEQFFDRIIDAEVVLRLENSGKIKDKIAEVKLIIPGAVLFVKESHRTFEASIDKATSSLGRQLLKYKGRRNRKG